jgi:hypothetical protein
MTQRTHLCAILSACLLACGSSSSTPDGGAPDAGGGAPPGSDAGPDAGSTGGAGGQGGSDAGADDGGPPPIADCARPEIRCVSASPGPHQEYATISACAADAMPGDTCQVFAGAYDERVKPARSGADGAFIVFQAVEPVKLRGFSLQGLDHIRVAGFELTAEGLSNDPVASVFLESSSDIQIVGNHIHHTSSDTCVRMRDQNHDGGSTRIWVKDNVIHHCSALGGTAPGIGITVYGDRNLVEGNDISHLGDDFTRVTGGDYNVLRNNTFHDNTLDDWPGSTSHIDGVQNWCLAGGVATHHLLIENNRLVDGPSPDTHFVIYQDYGLCGNGGFLVRHNTVQNLGDYIHINDEATRDVRLYHNTFVNTLVAQSTKDVTAVTFIDRSTGGKLFNNIFVDTSRPGGGVYGVDATSSAGFLAGGNLAYESTCGTACTWADLIKSEASAVLNQDPRFVSATDLGLQPGSPALDRAVPLTRVAAADTGSGTSLVVEDAGFFQDGWAGVAADWIAVGSAADAAQIVSIDVSTNVLTLAKPLSRSAGSSVWLYRDSSGRQVLHGAAPDIGAHERGP